MCINLYQCKKEYNLTDEEINFNPYKFGDSIFFQSSKGEKDTIIIYSLDRQKLNDKCYGFFSCAFNNIFGNQWEGYYINTIKPGEVWTGSNILSIRAEPNGAKTVYFELFLKNAWWYGDSEFNLDKIKSLPTISFKVKNQTFSDVVKIVSNNKEYIDRNDFIKTIYWSKSFGFVGFDKLNGDKWTVTKN